MKGVGVGGRGRELLLGVFIISPPPTLGQLGGGGGGRGQEES
jgi:hypothetical protein